MFKDILTQESSISSLIMQKFNLKEKQNNSYLLDQGILITLVMLQHDKKNGVVERKPKDLLTHQEIYIQSVRDYLE